MNMLLKIWSAYVRLTARWPSIASIVPFIPLFAAWWIVTTLEIFPRVFLPGPGEVWRSFVALTWKGILDASYETIRSSSGILLIVAVAALFGWILSVEGVPQKLTALMLQISTNPYVLLFIVNILLLVVGMFLDSTTAILVIAPIIAKPLVAAGVDPVHLGMVVVFNLMIGLLTPPMGLALFLVAEIAKVTMKDVLKEMLPYYIPLAITLLLITYFPAITTWIPRLALGNP